jgi:DNA-binding IclR family transcriptional regulator
MTITSTNPMETSSTVFKALDALTIMTAREEGISLPDLALALNQPRSNVVRIVHTLQHYGFVIHQGHRWTATSTFRAWSAPSDRHHRFRDRYRPILSALAAATGELVTLGLHEGNGIVHLDAIESTHRLCPVPVPQIRHSLRSNAFGKLALSRRHDLALKVSNPAFQQELDAVRRTGVAWSRAETARQVVAMAIPGFCNLPTEPMLAVTWPQARFTEAAATRARQVAVEAMAKSLQEEADTGRMPWTNDSSQMEFQHTSVA